MSRTSASAPPADFAAPVSGGLAWIALAAVLWSTGGVSVKSVAISGLAISAGRSLLAALLFLVAARGRVIPAPGSRGWFLVGALSYAYVVTSFVLSNQMTTAANAIILQYTAPLWIVVLAGPLLGERARPSDFAALALGAAGVVLCVWEGLAAPREGGLFSRQTLGDLLSLSSGVMFGLCTIAMRRANRGLTGSAGASASVRFLFAGNALAALIGAPALLAVGAAGQLDGGVLAVLLWLGVFQLGFGYFSYQHGMRVVPAFQASLVSLIEPILNPVWVALAVGEVPSGATLAGGGLVLAGMTVGLALGRRSGPAKVAPELPPPD